MRVGLTRSQEDIEKDRELFEKEGLEVIAIPLIEDQPVDFDVPLVSFDFVIFQSPRSVKYFLSKYELKDEKIVVVGEKTKRAVENFGYRVWAMPEDYYGENMVKLLSGFSGRVLIPRSAIGRDELIESLKAMGFEVYPIDVYTVKERLYPKEELKEKLKSVDVIVFASPSAIKGLLANLQKQEAIRLLEGKGIICIGKTTKDFLWRELSLDCLMPEKPTMEEVVRLIKGLA